MSKDELKDNKDSKTNLHNKDVLCNGCRRHIVNKNNKCDGCNKEPERCRCIGGMTLSEEKKYFAQMETGVIPKVESPGDTELFRVGVKNCQ